MTNLIRLDPFYLHNTHHVMDRLFDQGFSRPRRLLSAEQEAAFPVEVAEFEDSIEVKAVLPGVKPDEVKISVSNNILTVKAEHRDEAVEQKKDYHRREIRYGAYQRSLRLPTRVDSEHAEASFADGILSLRLLKAEAARPKQIKVTS